MKSNSYFSSLIDSYCKILIRSQNSKRSKVLFGSIKDISETEQIIKCYIDGNLTTIPINSIISIRPL
jgi:hypothetical protein